MESRKLKESDQKYHFAFLVARTLPYWIARGSFRYGWNRIQLIAKSHPCVEKQWVVLSTHRIATWNFWIIVGPRSIKAILLPVAYHAISENVDQGCPTPAVRTILVGTMH
jgi:hypothetical protein